MDFCHNTQTFEMLLIIVFFLISYHEQVLGSCLYDEFHCGDNTCIALVFRCDVFKDCKDGSDEVGCHVSTCGSDEFRCSDGTCITNAFRCDRFPDCKDGSDEVGCTELDKCKEGCQEPTLLYEDLHCKPTFASTTDCCPSYFNCSHIEDRSSSCDQKCHFHGKTYQEGESVSNYEIYGNCQSGCKCTKNSLGRMSFSCSTFVCPEWLGRSPKPGCVFRYEPNSCCNVGETCPPFNAVCTVGSKTYYEGQRFEAREAKCKTCVCQKGFEGKLEAPFCRRYQCIAEIRHQTEVEDFCAPSYLNVDDCCPINWICPENDVIIENQYPKSNHKCNFGDDLLNVGDKFERIHKESGGKVVCECRIPPYLTCIQDYKYPTQ